MTSCNICVFPYSFHFVFYLFKPHVLQNNVNLPSLSLRNLLIQVAKQTRCILVGITKPINIQSNLEVYSDIGGFILVNKYPQSEHCQ